MGWVYLIVCAAATAMFFNIEPTIGFYVSFALLAASFASFCLLYDDPIRRARHRVEQQLSQISSQGLHAEEYQRLQSSKITTNQSDREFRLTFMSGLNIATGILGGVMLLWALYARFG